MDEVHVYLCLHIASTKSTAGNKTRLFPIPFRISTKWFLILAGAFPDDQVAACSTALRSATERNEMGGYVTVPCSSKLTQRSSTADWLKFQRRHEIGYDRTHTEQIFTFKVMLCSYSSNRYCKIFDTVNLHLNYCASHFKKVDLYNN